MSKPMRLFCVKIVWRCAVLFIIYLCVFTCIHHQFAEGSRADETCVIFVEKPVEQEPQEESEGLEPTAADKTAQNIAGEQVVTLENPIRPTSRYSDLTPEEIDLLARIVWLEARGECAAGQQAVAEVVLNRIASSQFPDTLDAVIYQKGQFSTASRADQAIPTTVQYEAIYAAMYGENILPMDVVFFATSPENDNLWGWIENHAFCYAYNWED